MAAYEESSSGVVALLLDDVPQPRLGPMLRAARKQHGMTRREVANRVDTTSSALRHYERGDEPVPPSLVSQLAECYGEDLAAQFATRAPLQLDANTIAVGETTETLRSDDADEVLGTYVAIVGRLRRSEPGTPIALRADDVVALSSALGQPAADVEQRIMDLLGCTAAEAHSLHSEMLRRKLVVPVAGLVAGLAVVTGVGVGMANAGASAGKPPAPVTAPAPAHVSTPPTTVAAKPPVTPATTPAPPVTTPAPAATTPVTQAAPAPDPEPAATPAATPAPAETSETEAVQPAVTPVQKPVIAPDNTPMSVPPNEKVTIIQQ
jgi:transcriptional regulator with XRE-family HTH domain